MRPTPTLSAVFGRRSQVQHDQRSEVAGNLYSLMLGTIIAILSGRPIRAPIAPHPRPGDFIRASAGIVRPLPKSDCLPCGEGPSADAPTYPRTELGRMLGRYLDSQAYSQRDDRPAGALF